MRTVEIITHAIVIGAGATAVMDLWAACLRRFWRVPSLDYALLGRWIGHFPGGRFTHYAIGIVFATLLLLVWGPEWLERPTLLPALIVSSGTLVAPFLIMQPAMGAGIAASKTPRPHVARLRSLVTHTVYGVGLYVSAWLWLLLND